MFIDYNSCEPYLGSNRVSHKVDINKYGKPTEKKIFKFDVNNTQASNKIKFKVFRDGSRASDRLRQFGIGGDPSTELDEEIGMIG